MDIQNMFNEIIPPTPIPTYIISLPENIKTEEQIKKKK